MKAYYILGGFLMLNDYDLRLLGTQVKKFREKKGFSIEKLAEEIDVSTSHIKNIESANSNVSLKVIYRLANALGVTLNDLFYYSLTFEEKRATRLLRYIDRFEKYSDEEFGTITDSVIDLLDKLEGTGTSFFK